MIILATAVILSLNSSGIISKAQSAEDASDKASMKEYVRVLEAEWELMTKEQREETGYSSKEEYVNAKLKEKGFTIEESEDEENYEGANEIAKDALSKGLEIGDEVKYPVEANTWTPDSNKTGYTNSELTAQTNLKWIYIGLSEEGELLITPDVSTGVPANSNVTLYGKQGYLTGPGELNTTCDKLYTVEGKGTARSMNIDDVTRVLGYTGEKGSYYAKASGSGYTPTTEAKTISTLASEIDYDMEEEGFASAVPEAGKNIGDYYSDHYYINKTDDVGEINNPEYVNFIYPTSGYYWLASSCVGAYFSGGFAAFGVRYVNSSLVYSNDLFNSNDYENDDTLAVRPVVTLTSKIQKNTDDEGNVFWEFVS